MDFNNLIKKSRVESMLEAAANVFGQGIHMPKA